MIKIVSGSTVPVGSTIALVNMCNQFNARGVPCILFGPDNWHLDRCKSAPLSEFKPADNDIIIVNDIDLLSLDDLTDLPALIGARKSRFLRTVTSMLCGFSPGNTGNYRLVLTCQGSEPLRAKSVRPSLFHRIHVLPETSTNSPLPLFVSPNFINDLHQSAHKPEKVAGVIGTIKRANKLEQSIEKAIHDGMETVIIYGYLADPIYYYEKIVPLTSKFPGIIKFAGFIADQQRLYDAVSAVYVAVAKPWSKVPRECAMTNTTFHGPVAQTPDMDLTNDQIFEVWKTELGL